MNYKEFPYVKFNMGMLPLLKGTYLYFNYKNGQHVGYAMLNADLIKLSEHGVVSCITLETNWGGGRNIIEYWSFNHRNKDCFHIYVPPKTIGSLIDAELLKL